MRGWVKRHWVTIAVGIVAFGLGAAAGSGSNPDASSAASARDEPAVTLATTTTRATTTTAGPYAPTPTDFAITPIVLSQSCFGSAGCNLSYRIEVKYQGAQIPSATVTYRVVYEVRGGDSPKIGSFTVRGTQLTYPSEERISTPPNPALTVVATGVLKD